MKTTQILASISAIATAVQGLEIATYTDAHCSIMGPGLDNSTKQCVTSSIGFSSLELYSLPSNGAVTLYSGANCTGKTQGVNLMYRGCMNLGGFVAKSVDFCG
ncbi:hypothetical protein LTR86_005352 [Recurvomyces mirabilis]|nr:hypothetical protein LTR86_005352 [Recurvomyces mirabilis]